MVRRRPFFVEQSGNLPHKSLAGITGNPELVEFLWRPVYKSFWLVGRLVGIKDG
jgi:hypothetical protein